MSESRTFAQGWRRLGALALALLLGGIMTAPAQADDAADIAAIRAVLTKPAAGQFAPGFLKAMSIDEIASITASVVASVGSLTDAKRAGKGYALTFANGSGFATISLDDQKRITGLLFEGLRGPALQAALEQFASTPKLDAAQFSTTFLAAAPLAQIEAIRAQMKTQLGDYRSVGFDAGRYQLVYQKGRVPVTFVYLNADGKIDGLLLGPPKSVSLRDALETLERRSGTVGYRIIEGREQLAAFNAQRPMSVGSAFKLSVLAALDAQVAAGKRHWGDIATLTDRMKSVPSGRLQNWPSGTPFTLASLAGAMISESDNTATDALILTLGRSAIEPYAEGNVPFMTTRNLFALKTKGADADRETWRQGTIAQKRALLDALDARKPVIDRLDLSPAYLDIEWHYSPAQLCALMERVRHLDLTTINPGLAKQADWDRVSFKGGSDAGVVSLTTAVTAGKRTVCVSAIWNSPDGVDEKDFFAAYTDVLGQVKAMLTAR